MKKAFLLTCFFIFSIAVCFCQPANDNCSNASLLCPNVYQASNNIGATAQCGGADGDCGFGTWCFNVSNSVWFKFLTNENGGQATVLIENFSGSLDGALLTTSSACNASGYLVVNCVINQDSALTLTDSLLPNTLYWVMIDGTSANQTNFQIAVFGDAVQWSVNTTKVDASCENTCDGSATLTPQDGTPPYSYQWITATCITSTCSGLCPGAYNVTITDSIGCTALTTFTIGTLPPATISVTYTDEQCPGACNGTASATLSAGQTPYYYAWSTSPAQNTQTVTGLCSDTFSVTITDAVGCDTNTTVIIGSKPPASLSISSIDAQCPCTGSSSGSGSAKAVLSSGPEPISYLWNTNPVQTTQTATSLCPGTYSVTVTDSAGCDTFSTVTINVLPPPVASVSPEVNCGSGCIATATASLSSSQTPFTYQWFGNGQTSQTATGLCPGTDSVVVRDNAGCADTATYTIEEKPDLTVTVAKTDVRCNVPGSAFAKVEGGIEPFTYSWSNGASTAIISNLAPGTYSVTVVDSNDCSGTDEKTIALLECEMVPSEKFSPNGDGINDFWNITNSEDFPENKVTVYNRWGQLVYTANGYDNINTVWEGKLVPDGIYFFVIYEDKNNRKDKEGVMLGNVTILR